MVAAALSAAGSLFGGVAGYETGKYNRDVSNTMAIDAERDGTVEESRIRDAARMSMGNQVAAQGANGFQQGTGSAIDALTQSQINATLDALTARRQAAAKARGIRVQGAQAYAAGKNSLVGSMFGAASSAVRSNTDWASARAGQSSGGGAGAYGVSGSDGIV